MLAKTPKFFDKLFNFIEAKKPTYPLLFYRVLLSIICFGKFYVLKSNFNEFYGQYGLVQWTISKLSNFSFLPHLGDFAIFISKYVDISIDKSTDLLMQMLFLACFFLLIGLFTRISSILCFILHLTFINTGNGIIYGVDVFTQLSLFYAMFFPLNSTYSVDSLIGISEFKSTGIEKSLGSQWLNGEAIWRTFMMPIFKTYNFSWLAYYPFIPMIIGLMVLVIEIGYAFFMWKSKIRIIWFLMIVGLHLNIGLLMGMWYFAFIMIFLTTFAFGHDVIKDILSLRKNPVIISNAF